VTNAAAPSRESPGVSQDPGLAVATLPTPLFDAAICRAAERAAERLVIDMGVGQDLARALLRISGRRPSRRWIERLFDGHPSVASRPDPPVRPRDDGAEADGEPSGTWPGVRLACATPPAPEHSPGPAGVGPANEREMVQLW